jgi:hypothetical protein
MYILKRKADNHITVLLFIPLVFTFAEAAACQSDNDCTPDGFCHFAEFEATEAPAEQGACLPKQYLEAFENKSMAPVSRLDGARTAAGSLNGGPPEYSVNPHRVRMK